MKIYFGTGHAREAVQLLQSDIFGLKSRFAMQDPQLVSALLTQALETAEAWQEAVEYCRKLLSQQNTEEPGTPDDGKVWILLVRAAKASRSSK